MSQFAQTRQQAILSLLEQTGSITVAQAAAMANVSVVTARADLDALAKAGKLRRTHGGAVALMKTYTVSVQDKRVNVNAQAKRSIADVARKYVKDGDSVLIDSGTTALALVSTFSTLRDVTVITGDFSVADYVDKALPQIDVIMLGGMLHKAHRYTTGILTLNALSLLHPDKAFVCPGAYVSGYGFMTNHAAMAELKAAFMKCAAESFILLDSSKIEGAGLMRFATLDEADTIIIDNDEKGILINDLMNIGQDSKLIIAEN